MGTAPVSDNPPPADGAYAKAAEFGAALSEGGGDIYLWEHGVAVKPWEERVSGSELLDGIEGLITRFAVLPRWASVALALWVVHTYAYLLRNVATYIGIESPEKRCGKTTLLSVLCELVSRPVVASNISSPAFFRVIEKKKPTLVIDEGDTSLRHNQEMRGILNAGYTRKTAYVIRMRPRREERGQGGSDGEESGGGAGAKEDQGLALARYSSFCPKAIATIRHLPETLADRCIVISMQRKTNQDECERLRNLNGEELRRKCARFVGDHAEAIAKARPELPGDLNDRAADIWEPLLAVADLAGGDWPKKAREAALGLTAVKQDESPMGALLLDLMVMFVREQCEAGNEWMKKGQGRMFSRDMVAILNAYEDRPWMTLRRGKGVTELWLSQQLRPYGVKPKTIWMGDKSAKGYLEEDFLEVFRRYIPKSMARGFMEEAREAAAQRPAEAARPEPEEQPAEPPPEEAATLKGLQQQYQMLRRMAKQSRRNGDGEG